MVMGLEEVITTMTIDMQVNTVELKRLSIMLEENGIKHEYLEQPELGGATIKIPIFSEWTAGGVSVIQHLGSFGGPEGKLEVWIKPKEPEGWLTAEKVLAMVKDWMEKK